MENVKAIWNRYKMVTQGDSTYYGIYPGGGACALDPPSPVNSQPGWIMVAAGQYDYQKSVGCGMCIEITANGEQTSPETGGPTPMKGTYKAYIVDLCGSCNQAGFDLYISGYGKYKTSFKAVSCPSVPGQEGNIQFRFSGSNTWAIKLQARISKVVTVGMEIEHNNKWVCMEKTGDNYFSINGVGEVQFPKRFRLTSISGEQLLSTVPGIKNDENIPTDIQYSDFNPNSNPENIKCFGQGESAGQCEYLASIMAKMMKKKSTMNLFQGANRGRLFEWGRGPLKKLLSQSTYYGKYPGGGACALDPPSPVNSQPGWIMVAAGQYDYQKSVGCGMCIEITANGEQTSPETGGPTPMKGTYKAYIVDLCGGCNQAGFDLYISGYGKYKTSFKAVSCPSVPGQQGNIQFRFTGSNPWSIKLQARNSKVVTVGMEIEHNNKWVCMEKTGDNYFSINGLGEIKFPKRFRLTSISGEQLVS
ncbi:unnamed protein product, partial [Porites evermanni]